MSNGITNKQMFFMLLLILSTYSSITLPSTIAQESGRSSWIFILISSLIYALLSLFVIKLNSMFIGKTLFDYGKEIVGKFFTVLFSIYYLLHYFTFSAFFNITLSRLSKTNFLPNIPETVIMIFTVLLICFVANKGITNVARLLELYGCAFLTITILICLFMILSGCEINVLPLFSKADMKNYASAFKELIIPFGGIDLLLFIPFSNSNKKLAGKVAFFSILFIGIFYILLVEGTFAVLGVNNTIIYDGAFIEGLKICDAPVIERLDIFYFTFGLSSLFSGIIIPFTMTIEVACRIFSKLKRQTIILIAGLAVFAISYLLNMIFTNVEDAFAYFDYIIVLFSNYALPIVLFIIIKIKNFIKTDDNNIQKPQENILN